MCKIGLDASLVADAPDSELDAAEAGEEGEASAPDAEDDALEDVATEAGDASDDALDDAADDVVDGEAQDATAEAASEAGQPDSSGPVYALWDGSIEIDQDAVEDAAKGACQVSSAGRAAVTGAWLVVALAGGLGCWRRRRGGA